MILQNDKVQVNIKPEGAELTSIKYKGNEYLWNGDKKYWGRHAPILFPIVGKLKDNHMFVENKEYVMSQHGFARDSIFDEIPVSKSKAIYILKSNEQTLSVYPYKFQLCITYELIENKISVSYEVINIDDKDILFSIGAHPAFKWPLVDGENFEDYYIEFEKKETQKFISLKNGCVEFTEEKALYNENRIELNKNIFSIDTFIFKGLNSEGVSLKSKKSDKAVTVHFKKFPYFGIWSRTDEAKFICLEPWFGIADSVNSSGKFSEKIGIQKLKVGNKFNCNYEIEVE